MASATVNGQELFYVERGDGEDVIVFSHGLFMDHSMFRAQVEALAPRWRCIAWDERAHGRTVTTDDPFSYWDSAADLFGLLDHLEVERAVLAGMSQGGFLSMRAALTTPERVRALVLMDTQPGTENPAHIPGYDQLLAAWMAADGPPPAVLDTVAGIILGPGYDGTPAWQERWRAMPKPKIKQAYETLMSREDDVNPRLAELTMPALVIHGEQDVAIDLDVAKAFCDKLPAGELVVIPEAGHAANLTHPAQVNAALEPFLERLAA
jgi:pimeloyl-ACP methyl ester carboxylesterase